MPRTLVHKGRKIEVYHHTDAGRDGRPIERDAVMHPGAAAILPMVDAGRVCLLQNPRFILGQTLWEIPAGTLEPNEPPEAAAVRELTEETGYTAARWRKLAAFYPSPGVLSEQTHLFLAEGLKPGAMRPEDDETMEPRVVAWEQAMAWTLDGTIRDAKTLVALLLWDRLRPR